MNEKTSDISENMSDKSNENRELTLIDIAKKYPNLIIDARKKKIWKGKPCPPNTCFYALYVKRNSIDDKRKLTTVRVIPGGLDEIILSYIQDQMLTALCDKYSFLKY